MGFKNRSVVLLARPNEKAKVPWWPRSGGAYAWVTVYEDGWTLGVDKTKKTSLTRTLRLQANFLDEYEELRGMKGKSKWEWKTVSAVTGV